MVKKKSKLRKAFFGILALPLNVVAEIMSYLYVIHIRAKESSMKKHVRLEYLEKGIIKRNK